MLKSDVKLAAISGFNWYQILKSYSKMCCQAPKTTLALREILLIFIQMMLAFWAAEVQSAPSATAIPPASTTTPRFICGVTPAAEDYQAWCNATNGFTLPNGRFVDQYRRFCICTPSAMYETCTGRKDFPPVRCNTDGSYQCVTEYNGVEYCTADLRPLESPFNPIPNLAPCGPNCQTVCAGRGSFCQPACVRYSAEFHRFLNVGGCTCTLAQTQQDDTALSASDNYVPQCNGDGSWQKLQTGYGGTWCVDSSGNPTGDISFDLKRTPTCY